MRKRPMLLLAAGAAAGLAVLGTVMAQPGSYLPASKTAPAASGSTPVRPYSEWTPTGGATRPAGGSYLPPPTGGMQPAV
ncbi:MAG: hypothetical protein FJ304_07115, partial [Planctomycetes bacterium]|nr:hypothetical protein [Planctomycetota bacterium]